MSLTFFNKLCGLELIFSVNNFSPVSHTGDSDTSPQTQAAIETEIRGLIEAAQTRATELLKSKKVELERLARALVEHETLDLNEVKRGMYSSCILRKGTKY